MKDETWYRIKGMIFIMIVAATICIYCFTGKRKWTECDQAQKDYRELAAPNTISPENKLELLRVMDSIVKCKCKTK